jgi:hypothetical protein
MNQSINQPTGQFAVISQIIKFPDARFEVFTAVKVELVVFWLLAPCGMVVGYQSFRGPEQ